MNKTITIRKVKDLEKHALIAESTDICLRTVKNPATIITETIIVTTAIIIEITIIIKIEDGTIKEANKIGIIKPTKIIGMHKVTFLNNSNNRITIIFRQIMLNQK